ncbi:hypothetical protein M634_09085 [Vibrio parahaemolyticus O1:Kuk str. FDA_R31]|nr:hypothetical protein M634_09085 [Vibrio parahaemolyticus O1:Kuk str. FDA_R31]KIT46312.1 hypothetical protein H331_19710 [Vibrio parahaemolyticus 3644]KIT50863.1 hypothetical protein H336_01075 [Vibrio parahaemolyticus EN9701072]PIS71543.1 hypothetical protein H271_04255 [Vibrio parahaemolyticus 1911C]
MLFSLAQKIQTLCPNILPTKQMDSFMNAKLALFQLRCNQQKGSECSLFF